MLGIMLMLCFSQLVKKEKNAGSSKFGHYGHFIKYQKRPHHLKNLNTFPAE